MQGLLAWSCTQGMHFSMLIPCMEEHIPLLALACHVTGMTRGFEGRKLLHTATLSICRTLARDMLV